MGNIYKKAKYTFLTNGNLTNLQPFIKKDISHSTAQINTLEEIGGGAGSGFIRHSRLPSIKSRDKKQWCKSAHWVGKKIEFHLPSRLVNFSYHLPALKCYLAPKI